MSDERTQGNVASTVRKPGDLHDSEYYWRARQPWLRERGYALRQRYSPDWIPSWNGTKKRFFLCEDGWALTHPYILDATRISDGTMVMLKKTSKSVHPYEAEIGQFFSSQPLDADPRNHCIHIYEVFQDPEEDDSLILVMPFLRPYNDPRFDTVGEAIEFFRQGFEGLQFMHQNHVAHRDIMELNMMMDPIPLFPELYHPIDQYRKRDFSGTVKPFTRTKRPTTYFFVDYGHARKYDPESGPPLELPILGGDKTVPEFQNDGYNKPWDPFPTDIYYMGNLIREDFLRKYTGLEFMGALIAEMVQDDPSKRPTIDQVVDRFEKIRRAITSWNCRSRLVSRREDILTRVFKDVRHVFRTTGYIVRRLPPVPTPSTKS